jgi:hypothetical protein
MAGIDQAIEFMAFPSRSSIPGREYKILFTIQLRETHEKGKTTPFHFKRFPCHQKIKAQSLALRLIRSGNRSPFTGRDYVISVHFIPVVPFSILNSIKYN